MQRTRVQICGVTRVEDAVLAARAGADAIGMVLHAQAPRCISRQLAAQIVASLPPFVTPVGLFVDTDTREILSVAEELGLRTVQLHGRETPQQVAELMGLKVIKAVHVQASSLAQDLETWRQAVTALALTNLEGIVLETGGTRQAGGTGVENDWAAIRRHQEAGDFDGLPAIIAAGGLTPENVGQVVRQLRPYAVDVSSGVESVPGTKSQEKIRAFMGAVWSAG